LSGGCWKSPATTAPKPPKSLKSANALSTAKSKIIICKQGEYQNPLFRFFHIFKIYMLRNCAASNTELSLPHRVLSPHRTAIQLSIIHSFPFQPVLCKYSPVSQIHFVVGIKVGHSTICVFLQQPLLYHHHQIGFIHITVVGDIGAAA